MDVVSNIASRPKKVTPTSAKGADNSRPEISGRPRNWRDWRPWEMQGQGTTEKRSN